MAEALILAVSLIALFIFFIPALLAYSRGSRHRLVILIANVAVGWTGIGWLVVLALAAWPQGDALPVAITSVPDTSPAKPTGSTMVAGEPQSSSGQLLQTLSTLAELREAGVLSDEEFNQKKQEILAAL